MAELPPELVRRELEAILSSPVFKNSGRLSRFLRYVVEQSLHGNADALKEYQIGVDVFGRGAAYDTRTDPVVRVEARQLRFKLAEYYNNYGAADEIVINLPKGRYAAHFERRAGVEPSEAVEPAPLELAEVMNGPAAKIAAVGASRGLSPRRWLAVVVLGAAMLGGLVLLSRIERSNRPAPAVHKTNPEAEALYLKGKYYWTKRTPESLNQAVDSFTQAIVKDPGYASAYVGLADTYNLLSEYTTMPYREAFTRAIAAAQRAIELDERLADAHNSLAFASFYGAWDAVTAEREFKRALELNPNYVVAHHWYATFLMSRGRSREALAEIERAQKLDPASNSILADKGLILYNGGRTQDSIALLGQLAASEPSFLSPHSYLASIYLITGRYAEYLAESRKAAVLSQDAQALESAAAAEKAFATGGGRGMLQAMLAMGEKSALPGRGRNVAIAEIAALLGDKATAMRYLKAAFAERELGMLVLGVNPAFASLHGEAGFIELVRQVAEFRMRSS